MAGRYGFDEKKIARFHKEGRGTGHGADYKPWLTVRDVPSTGRSNRAVSWKTARVHQFMSDIERDIFYLLDWSDTVLDIREQFPLDRKQTIRIAEEMGVKHPADVKSKVDWVMTTDFVVDIARGGQVVIVARAAKPSRELEDARILEKLEIERRYWAERNVDWGIVTELDIPDTMARNIEGVHPYVSVDNLRQPQPGYYSEKAAIIGREVASYASITLGEFCSEMDVRLEMKATTSLMLVRHLVATKVLICDMSKPIEASMPMRLFQTAAQNSERASA